MELETQENFDEISLLVESSEINEYSIYQTFDKRLQPIYQKFDKSIEISS